MTSKEIRYKITKKIKEELKINQLALVLKELRKSKNLTQNEISKEINITQRAYSFYETGKREPNIDTLIKLADFYKVSLDYITGRYIKK